MLDARVTLVNELIVRTKHGRIKWQVGARSDQFLVHVASGSLVLSRYETFESRMGIINPNAPKVTGGAIPHSEAIQDDRVGGASAGAPTYDQAANVQTTRDYKYTLDIRDTEANIIETVTSESWKWLPGARPPDALKVLHNLILEDARQQIDNALQNIINDLNAL